VKTEKKRHFIVMIMKKACMPTWFWVRWWISIN